MQRQDYIKILLARKTSSLEDYDDISYAFDNLYLIRDKKKNLYGLIKPDSGEVIPCNYKKYEVEKIIKEKQKDEVALESSFLKVSTKDYLKGYVNLFSKLIIPYMYEKALPFSENLAAVRYEGNWGFINEKNQEVIPFEYEYARSFKEGMAPVKKDGKWGYIDKLGNVKVPFVLDKAFEFKDGYALITFLSQEYFMDKNLSLLKNLVFEDLYLKDINELPYDVLEYKILEYIGLLEFETESVIISEKKLEDYIKVVSEIEEYKVNYNLGEFSKRLKKIK